MIEVKKTEIDGVYIIEPSVYGDDRGYFFESFNEKEFNEKTNANFHPVQDNESLSNKGVLRGLHFQNEPYAQAKLVRVVEGDVYDVAVDIRPDSPTFGKYVGVLLSGLNKKQFFIPKGFAHGFFVLTNYARFQYKCDNYYAPDYENGIAWDDKDVNIKWPDPTEPIEKIILSNKDINRQTLKEYLEKITKNKK